MCSTETCQLTMKDYTILKVMQERHPGHHKTMAGILHRKVSHALVMFRHVHRSDSLPAGPKKVMAAVETGFDDPGPSAA